MAAAGTAFKVKIHECKLIVRKVKLTPSVYLAHAKALEVGNAKYPINRAVCKSYTIPTGLLNHSQENLFTGQMPTRLIVALVDNTAYNGAYAENPFNFKHFSLSQMKIYIDGQQQHIRPIETNYERGQFLNAYLTLFSGSGKLFRDEGLDIDRSDYPHGYAIYAFDLTPDESEDGHFNLVREGSLRLDLKFAVALPNTINVLVYSESENVLQIDRNKNIIFDYTN